MEKMYNVEQLCEMLHQRKSTMWRWIREGKLEASKLGKSYLVKESEVQRMIDDNLKKWGR